LATVLPLGARPPPAAEMAATIRKHQRFSKARSCTHQKQFLSVHDIIPFNISLLGIRLLNGLYKREHRRGSLACYANDAWRTMKRRERIDVLHSISVQGESMGPMSQPNTDEEKGHTNRNRH
jgi:hypothetical protein